MTCNVKCSIHSFDFQAGHGQKQVLMVWIYLFFCILNGIEKKNIFLSFPLLSLPVDRLQSCCLEVATMLSVGKEIDLSSSP